MTRNHLARLWIEAVLSGITAALTALTVVSGSWIEAVFGVNLDQGNGALEWTLIAGLATVSVTLGLLARAESASAKRAPIAR